MAGLRLMSSSSEPPDSSPALEVVVEVPRGGFIKRRPDGRFEFLSPLPSPFNYGSVLRGAVPGVTPGDGDPLDALILGSREARGASLEVRAWGWVDFVDAGEADPKLVCTLAGRPSRLDWLRVRAFFVCYAPFKGALQRARGRAGETRLRGIHEL